MKIYLRPQAISIPPVRQLSGIAVSIDPLVGNLINGLDLLSSGYWDKPERAIPKQKASITETAKEIASADINPVIFAWLTLNNLGGFRIEKIKTPAPTLIRSYIDQWLLLKDIKSAIGELSKDGDLAYWDSQLVLILISHSDWLASLEDENLGEAFRRLLIDTSVREYLQVHSHKETLWLNKERLERLANSLALTAWLNTAFEESSDKILFADFNQYAQRIIAAADKAQYQVDKLIEILAE